LCAIYGGPYLLNKGAFLNLHSRNLRIKGKTPLDLILTQSKETVLSIFNNLDDEDKIIKTAEELKKKKQLNTDRNDDEDKLPDSKLELFVEMPKQHFMDCFGKLLFEKRTNELYDIYMACAIRYNLALYLIARHEFKSNVQLQPLEKLPWNLREKMPTYDAEARKIFPTSALLKTEETKKEILLDYTDVPIAMLLDKKK
jgi:hypothetical protein